MSEITELRREIKKLKAQLEGEVRNVKKGQIASIDKVFLLENLRRMLKGQIHRGT